MSTSPCNCSSAEEFNKFKNIKDTKITTLRNACIIRESLIQKFDSENANSVDEMIQVTVDSCFVRDSDENGDELFEFTDPSR